MSRIQRGARLSAVLFFLLTLWAYVQFVPAFWVAGAFLVASLLVVMGKRWVVRTILWFGVFVLLKIVSHMSLFAFLGASLVVRLLPRKQ